MPIDLTAVDWAFVGILTILCFVAALLGSLISFRNKLGGAILAAVLFAVGLVGWMYYPHPQLPGPVMPRAAVPTAAATPAPAPTPVRPANPVTTLTQPTNPVETVSPPPAPAAPK
jgi:hypothetical protein